MLVLGVTVVMWDAKWWTLGAVGLCVLATFDVVYLGRRFARQLDESRKRLLEH